MNPGGGTAEREGLRADLDQAYLAGLGFELEPFRNQRRLVQAPDLPARPGFAEKTLLPK